MVILGITVPAALLALARLITVVQAVVVNSPKDAYDYIIVGGGTSGCVVASRLTEDSDVSVLVIEAGPILDGQDEFLQLLIRPTFENKAASASAYQWPNLTTEPIEGLNGRTKPMANARIAGGGSAINGKFFCRGAKRDYDDWARYLDDDGWNWSSMLSYFKKSETFTPPLESYREQGNVTWDMQYHGQDGPISSTFPPQFFPSVTHVIAAEKNLGIPQKPEQASGDPIGSIWYPISSRPETYTRSYSKREYYDPIRQRPNIDFLADHTVTKILFNGTCAVGVEFGDQRDGPVTAVGVNKEVIVAAGPTKSPQLLQISGVGPSRLSQSLNVTSVNDLPVGDNYQDHGVILLSYDLNVTFDERMWDLKTNKTWYDEQYRLFAEEGEGWLTAYSDNHMTLLSATMLHNHSIDSLLDQYKDNATQYLRPNVDARTAEAYLKQHSILMTSIATNDQAVDENSNLGVRNILVKPLSRGYVEAKTTNIWDPPAINHRTFSHPLDLDNMLASLKYTRKVLSAPETEPLTPVETQPGSRLQTDDDLKEWIRNNMSPGAAHGCCAVPMGTVLDTRLRVHGVQGLRVVDTSSWPMIPGAHSSQSTAYAVAEKAADLIKEG